MARRSSHDLFDALPLNPVRTTYSVAEVSIYPPSLAVLSLDGVDSSAIDLQDPTYLEFEYMQHMMAGVDAFFPGGRPLRVMHIGAAACAFALALHHLRPGSRQLAIDLDAELVRLVREWFPLPSAPALRLRAEDGFTALARSRATMDVLVRDAFSNALVPESLTTPEALTHCARIVGDGLYVANTGLGGGADPRQELRSTLDAFPMVLGVANSAVAKGRAFGNLVLYAAKELPVEAIEREVRRLTFPATIISRSTLEGWAG